MKGIGFFIYDAVLVMYTVSFVLMRLKRHIAENQNPGTEKKESRLLYQGFIVVVPFAIFLLCFQVGYVISSEKLLTLGNYMLFVALVSNPFVYLWFNRDLRNDVRRMLGLGSGTTVQPIRSSEPNHSNHRSNLVAVDVM